MDEGKESLGVTGAPDIDISGDAATSPSTSPSPTASKQIISSAGLPPATPLSSPLPTDPLHPIQTVGSGSGDIVVGRGRGGGSKRGIVIGVIVGAIVLFVGLVVLLPVLLRDSDQEVLSLLKQNIEPVEYVEKLFENTYFRETTTVDIMTTEVHEQLDRNMSQFINFQDRLAKINPNKVSNNVREDFQKLRDTLAAQAEPFSKAAELYNVLYAVYTTENTEGLDVYLQSEDYAVATIAERFSEFIHEKQNLQTEIEANSCALDGANNTDICSELVAEYHDTIDSMEQSYAVPQAILFAYFDEPSYEEENYVQNAMRKIIEELEK